MAAVYSPEFLMHPTAPPTPRAAPPTGSKKGSGNGTRTRTGAAATGVSPSSSTAPRTPKLRDSCDACAAAKVRCTKKKPTCTRCDKRGLNCEYIATKRAGRPSQSATQNTTKVMKSSHDPRRTDVLNEVHVLSPPSSCKTTPSEGTLSASPRLIESPTMSQQTITCQDALPDLLASSIDSTMASSSLTSFSAELDNFFASLGSFPGLETPPHDILSLPSCVDSMSNPMDASDTIALMSEDNFSIAKDACSDMPFLTNPHTLPNIRPPFTGHMESLPALCADSPCFCLITALGFLKELFPDASKACAQPAEQTSGGSPFPTIQSVIAENERIVEAMDSILQCPCSQDVYLLTVLSLIVFKVLDRYAAAGRAAPTVTTTAPPTTMMADSCNQLNLSSSSSYPCNLQRHPSSQFTGSSSNSLCIDSEDSGRVAAQMVLSELHRAQRLVNKLSARFKAHSIGGGGGVGTVEVGGAAPNNCSTTTTTTTGDTIDMLCDPSEDSTRPFSTTMLDQMEADLRGRLRAVSLNVVDMIRRV